MHFVIGISVRENLITFFSLIYRYSEGNQVETLSPIGRNIKKKLFAYHFYGALKDLKPKKKKKKKMQKNY